jgi:uncharacterized protein
MWQPISLIMLGITYDEGLDVAMRDGTVLRADCWRPQRAGRYPVLLMRLPYGKSGAQDWTYAHPWWWASQGYAVVVQDTRGRFSSDGEFEPFVSEGDDSEDTIAWAAEQPFSDGRVGMYGFSYAGMTQLRGAVRRPEGLAAIAPAMTQAEHYEGWAYHHGAFSLAFNASWATFLAQNIGRRTHGSSLESELMTQFVSMPALYGTLPVRDIPHLGRDGPGRFFQDWLDHETRDDYWNRVDVRDDLASIDSAAFVVAGLHDIFLEGNLEVFERLSTGPRAEDARLVVGPWYHVPWIRSFGELDYGAEAANTVSETQLRFFDQWLRDGDPFDGPRARWFVTGANTWQTSDDWPPPSTPWVLHLRSRGRANSLSGLGFLSEEAPGAEAPDVFSYDPAVPVPSRGGRSCCEEGVAPIGPADQRPLEMMNQVLVYTTPPLDQDRLVVGRIQARLFAATSARDTDWTVKVCDVHPDGRAINVQESIQRARFAAGDETPRLIPPGEVSEFRFDVGSCSHLFRAGHAIRVEVSSSNFPQWDRNLNTGNPVGEDTISDRVVATQFVLHDSDHPSSISLPLLG